MRNRLAAALLLTLTAAPAWADSDHDRARAAVVAREAMPLETVLEQAKRDYPGRLLEAELEDERGRLAYEIKILGDDGRVVELLYDARDGHLLRQKGGKR